EVLRELLPDAVNNAIDEHSLSAIGQPNVEFDNNEALEKPGEAPLTVTVGLEVLPEIKLDKYKGLEVQRSVRPVTDEDIDQTIENVRNASAALVPVEDRGAELGDTVTINARGNFVENPEEEDIKVDDVEVVLGGPGVQQEFTDNLLGTRADEKKSFTVEYPADFSSPGLAGKKVTYEADITSVRRKELPEVDDEWAKSLGDESETVETLKAKIRHDLELHAKGDADRRLQAELVRQLVAAHQFEVPQSFVEQQTNQRLQTVVREMIGRGFDPRNPNMNWEGA